MSRRFTVTAVILALLLSLATVAVATGISSYRLSVPGGIDSGSLTYGGGTFVAAQSGNTVALFGGTWQDQGCALQSATWSNVGIVGYDDAGRPTLSNAHGQTTLVPSTLFGGQPLIRPATSPNGVLMFGKVTTDFLVQVAPWGTNPSQAYLPFNSKIGAWWLTSCDYASESVFFVAGQETTLYNPITRGYDVMGFKNGVAFDTWLALSEIAVGGGHLFGTSPDHTSISAWKLGADGKPGFCDWSMSGGYFNILGSDANGVAFRQGSYINYAGVPEPTSLVAMLTGIVGLAGWGKKRRS